MLVSVPDGYIVEPLSAFHDRSQFDCGEASLDSFLKTQAGQSSPDRKETSTTHALLERGTLAVVGYISLAITVLPFHNMPSAMAKSHPKEKPIPGILLGRLARPHRVTRPEPINFP